jgi:predicted DNA-binding transcriptional regulator YafY
VFPPSRTHPSRGGLRYGLRSLGCRLLVVVGGDHAFGVNRTDRLYALVEELRAAAPHWRSAQWLASKFEVTSRTIERDLSALQQAGVPIYATPGRRGGYAIDVQHTLPPLNLSAAEVAAIATALAADRAAPFTHAGRTALQKILAVLAEVDADGVQDLASRIRVYDRPDDQNRPSAIVERAIVAKQVLEITYRDKTGETSTRTVEPVAVLGVRPHWYLWAWCRSRNDPRSFRLDRIIDAAMTDDVAPDRGLDPAALELAELVGRGILGS